MIFLYSHDNDKGLWYLPGSGIGPLLVAGRQIMKEAIAAGPHRLATGKDRLTPFRSLRRSMDLGEDLIASAEGADSLKKWSVTRPRREAIYPA